MISRKGARDNWAVKTVFFDVDTQLDFLSPAGSLAVPGAASIQPALTILTAYATAKQVTIVSTVDAHAEDDPEFRTWRPHCVVGTAGQQKSAVTLTKSTITLGSNVGALEPVLGLALTTGVQVILEKQFLDVFTNPNLVPLLEALAASRYVVYGLVTELCVQCATVGLLNTGARVELVADAVKSLDPVKEREMISLFQQQGGLLTTVAEVMRSTF